MHNYQLTNDDVAILKKNGYLKKDIFEIEKWYLHLNYEIVDAPKRTRYKHISLEKILPLIEREEWLSGISRAVFHRTASRHLKDGTEVIFEMT